MKIATLIAYRVTPSSEIFALFLACWRVAYENRNCATRTSFSRCVPRRKHCKYFMSGEMAARTFTHLSSITTMPRALTPLSAVAAQLTASRSTPAISVPSRGSIRTFVRASEPAYAPSAKRAFKGLFKKSAGVASGEHAGLSLFNQSSLPEDLQLPKPADPLQRIGAGILDLAVAGLAGSAAGYMAFATSGVMEIALSTGQGAGLAYWILRDGLADEGNRSFGKKAFGLEITNADGTLASPWACLARNWYFGIVPALSLHPLLGMTFEMLVFFDMASLALTSDARKVGDYSLGTRVVDERPGRDLRVQDMLEAAEIRALRAEIESLAPGLLAQHPDNWYDQTQKSIVASHAAAKALKQAAKVAAGGQADMTMGVAAAAPLNSSAAAVGSFATVADGTEAGAAQSPFNGISLPYGPKGAETLPLLGKGMFSEIKGIHDDLNVEDSIRDAAKAGSRGPTSTLAGDKLHTQRPKPRKA